MVDRVLARFHVILSFYLLFKFSSAFWLTSPTSLGSQCRLTFQNHTFTRLMDYNNGFSISSFFLSLSSFLWIGAQFPQEKFLSYGRILTLDFYFLLMCILFLLLFLFFFFISFLLFYWNSYWKRRWKRKSFVIAGKL